MNDGIVCLPHTVQSLGHAFPALRRGACVIERCSPQPVPSPPPRNVAFPCPASLPLLRHSPSAFTSAIRSLGEFCFDQQVPDSQINFRAIKSAMSGTICYLGFGSLKSPTAIASPGLGPIGTRIRRFPLASSPWATMYLFRLFRASINRSMLRLKVSENIHPSTRGA
jgi:hypothetical protein